MIIKCFCPSFFSDSPIKELSLRAENLKLDFTKYEGLKAERVIVAL